MPEVAPIVTVFGGSGFIGRYICQRLAREGWRVRVAVRRPNDANFVRTYGLVGQVEPVQANVRDDASVRRAMHGATAVINCVGILVTSGRQTFAAVHAEAPGRIARIASELGVARLVQISAIGADPTSDSDYARTKAAGEQAVQAAFPEAVILRPSIVFGVEDRFFNRFAGMTRYMPVLPLVSPETRFQPVYVADVAKVAVKAVSEPVEPGVYELGGPEVCTFRALMERMFLVIDRRRPIISVPLGLARIQARILDFLQRVTFGLFTNNLLTEDQVRLLGHDNVVASEARGFEAFGIVPTPMAAILDTYLFSYRHGGQFARLHSPEMMGQE